MLNLIAWTVESLNAIQGLSQHHYYESSNIPIQEVPFWGMFSGCCELCKPAIWAPFIHLTWGTSQIVHVPVFRFIISICSHLKRLANPRSHASSAPRIICVCFLMRRRDCVNLLRGKKEREMERARGKEKERPMSCSYCKLKKRKHGASESEIRQETSDRGKGWQQRKNKVKREI